MYPIISFSDAHERAGFSSRSGKFLVSKDSSWIEFTFIKTGWIKKKIILELEDGTKINSGGTILENDGSKVGEIRISRKILSFWKAECEIHGKKFTLSGIEIIKKINSQEKPYLEINVYSTDGILCICGNHRDPFLFPFSLGKDVASKIRIKTEDKYQILAIIYYLCLMGSNNC